MPLGRLTGNAVIRAAFSSFSLRVQLFRPSRCGRARLTFFAPRALTSLRQAAPLSFCAPCRGPDFGRAHRRYTVLFAHVSAHEREESFRNPEFQSFCSSVRPSAAVNSPCLVSPLTLLVSPDLSLLVREAGRLKDINSNSLSNIIFHDHLSTSLSVP